MKELNIIQKQYILQWIALLGLAEFFIFILPTQQTTILLLISGGFFVGFIMRVLRLHPGRREPLILDLLSWCLALLLSAYATGLKPSNSIILVLLPILTIPHIVYIISHRF
jgi:chromate transport protein ChrA